MTPGPTVYPGSPAERQKETNKADVAAFVQRLRDQGDPRADEIANMYEAEGLGLKPAPGQFSKAGAASKHRVIFDPVKKTYLDGITQKPVTDQADLENAQVDRAAEPKDHSAQNAAQAARVQAVREHAYSEFKDSLKPLTDRIDRADKLQTSLDSHTDIADSTIAEQLVTLTAGGNGSGIRISQPMIDQVLNKSRTKWDSFEQALKLWNVAPADKKANLGLFFSDPQRQAISDLGKLYRQEAIKTRSKILKYRSQIDDAETIPDINHLRTKAQNDLFESGGDESTMSAPAAKPKRTAEQILKEAGL
jgi:hypothetical protein